MSTYNSDIVQLFSDSGLVLVSKISTMGIAFLAHTFLVRNLDPGRFGMLSLAVTIVTVSAGFAALGMGQTVTRFISASSREDASQYTIIAMSVALLGGGGLAVAMLWNLTILETFFSSPGLSDLLKVFVLLLVLRPTAGVLLGVVRGFEKTNWKIIYNDILPFVLSFVILLLFLKQGRIILGAFLFYICRPAFRILFLSATLVQWKEWQFDLVVPDWPKVSRTFSFAWPLAFQGLVATFLGNMDVIMLGWLSSSANVGLYRSIQPVSQTLIFLLSSLTFIYLPIATRYFADNEFDKLDSIYKTVTRWITQFTFPLFLFYLLFGQDFIRAVFTEEYTLAWVALAILSVGMYSRVFVGPNGMTIKAIDRTREDLLSSISALITNAALNVVLIPQYGIEGAAIATTLSFFVYNTIEITLIYKYTGVSPFHWHLIAPMFPTAFVILVITRTVGFRTSSLPILFVIGLGIFVVHLVSIGIVTGLQPEDKILIQQIQNN